jgi:hypothetical protein
MTEHSSGLAGSWVGLFVFDTVIFGLTVYNGYQTRRRMTPAPNLHSIVVRDGPLNISAVYIEPDFLSYQGAIYFGLEIPFFDIFI